MSKIISIIVYYLMRALHGSFCYEVVGEEHRESLAGKPYLFSVWHCQLANAILAQTGTTHVVMVSRSKDADPVAYLCERLGHVVARGSSAKGGRDKGGSQALVEMVNRVQEGYPAALTVDGPTGPARKVKAGIIKLAHKTGVPIIPYTVLCEKYWEFNSWDKFRFPKPFTKVKVIYGKPIDVQELSIEEAMNVVELAINQNEQEHGL